MPVLGCFAEKLLIYCPLYAATRIRSSGTRNRVKEGRSVKFILGIIFGALVIIFMVQNVQVVDIKFLAWTMSISRALVILIVLVIGILLGWVLRSIGYRKKRKAVEKTVE
jgi:uncharacterized integral membrane protein